MAADRAGDRADAIPDVDPDGVMMQALLAELDEDEAMTAMQVMVPFLRAAQPEAESEEGERLRKENERLREMVETAQRSARAWQRSYDGLAAERLRAAHPEADRAPEVPLGEGGHVQADEAESFDQAPGEVETVALAIYESRVHSAIIHGWRSDPEALKDRFRKAALAALNAARGRSRDDTAAEGVPDGTYGGARPPADESRVVVLLTQGRAHGPSVYRRHLADGIVTRCGIELAGVAIPDPPDIGDPSACRTCFPRGTVQP